MNPTPEKTQVERLRLAAETLGVGAISWLGCHIAMAFLIEPEGMSPFWFANGVVMAVLLRRPRRQWPFLLGGAFSGFIVNMLVGGFPPIPNVFYGLANVLEPLLGALAIERFMPRFLLRSLRSFLILLLASLGASLVGATLAWLAGPIRWDLWLLDDLLGLLLVSPAILVFWPAKGRSVESMSWSAWRMVEVAAIACGLFAVTWSTFGSNNNTSALHYFYLIMPFMIWATTRYQDKGAILSSAALAVLTIGFTVKGFGPFTIQSPHVIDRSLGIQVFLAVVSLSNLAVGILLLERKHVARIRSGQIRVLERIVDDEPLPNVLDYIVRLVEAEESGLICSILRYDPETKRLHHGAAPNLPQALNDAIDGAEVGPNAGSCGAAAFAARRVVVADIASHPNWAEYKDWALPYGIKACWSTPILSHEREVLGTFAIYYKVARLPDHQEIGWVDAATTLAAIALVRERAKVRAKNLEQQVIQAQRLESLGTLAGGIAHDFNNILTAVSGNVGLAKKLLEEDHKAQTRLDVVQDACARAADLVRQIMMFGRPQAPRRVPTRLGALIEENARLLRASLPLSMKLTTTIGPDEADVEVDPSQIYQVIMNLGTNAVQAMAGGGGSLAIGLDRVELTSALAGVSSEVAAGSYMRLTVKDDGKGIDASAVCRIFEPFFTTKGDGGGTGLGLAVVLGIIRSHGGTIRVSSRPGEGTTFELYFPVAAPTSLNGIKSSSTDQGYARR